MNAETDSAQPLLTHSYLSVNSRIATQANNKSPHMMTSVSEHVHLHMYSSMYPGTPSLVINLEKLSPTGPY